MAASGGIAASGVVAKVRIEGGSGPSLVFWIIRAGAYPSP
jgi:hypothetical protein